jgi:hypothetical protein
VSASNLGNDYINEENSPIPIPPAKDGWADMERRLNATPSRVRVPLLQKAAMIAAMVVVSGVAFAITYYTIFRSRNNHPPVHAPKQHPALTDTPSARTPAGENIFLADTIQHSYFSRYKYLPASAGITGTDERHRVTPLVVTSATGNVSETDTNNAHPGNGTNANNETAGSNAETAAAAAGGPDKSTTHGAGRNAGVGANANSVAHSAGTGTNAKANNRGARANANPIAHNADGTPPNPPPPDAAAVTNVKAATKKTKPVAVAKQRAYNLSSATTASNTSPEKNTNDIPATTPAKGDIIHSQQTWLLQSLPLTLINRSALAQRPPESITSHANKTPLRELPEWQLLLQWQVPVPLSGSAYYLSGPAGNNQLHRLLIPGIRAVRKWNANAISLDLTPFTAQTYNDPLIRESSSQNSDSSTNKLKLTLRKEFGASGTILYHRRIFKQWQVAAGIQLNYWMQQSNNQQTIHYPRWTTTPSDSSTTVVKENIQRPQLKVPLEVYYDAHRWQAGLRVDLPLNINRSDSITSRIKTPVQLQLMLRYKLLPRRR